jgi:hypothetical protein
MRRVELFDDGLDLLNFIKNNELDEDRDRIEYLISLYKKGVLYFTNREHLFKELDNLKDKECSLIMLWDEG